METHIPAVRRHHKRRWAPTQDRISDLSRSARQLARNSASRIRQPETRKQLQRLKLLIEAERVCKLLIADQIVTLIDGHGLRAIDIARETSWQPSDISQMYQTVK